MNRGLTRTLLVTGMMVVTLGGCAAALKKRPPEPFRSEVAKVVCIYDLNPFVSFDDEGDLNVEGFRITVVLASRKTGRGVAEDGIIRVRMYRRHVGPEGKPVRTLVRDWPTETAGLTTFTSPLFGEGYKLQFRWAWDDEVLGCDVQIVVAFETRDGRTIRSQTKSLKVPPRKGP